MVYDYWCDGAVGVENCLGFIVDVYVLNVNDTQFSITQGLINNFTETAYQVVMVQMESIDWPLVDFIDIIFGINTLNYSIFNLIPIWFFMFDLMVKL